MNMLFLVMQLSFSGTKAVSGFRRPKKKNGIVDVLMMSVSDQMLKSSCLDKSEIIGRILFVQRI